MLHQKHFTGAFNTFHIIILFRGSKALEYLTLRTLGSLLHLVGLSRNSSVVTTVAVISDVHAMDYYLDGKDVTLDMALACGYYDLLWCSPLPCELPGHSFLSVL
jgi:hypothetical protein